MSVENISTNAAVRIDFGRFPRVNLCHQPTPIEELPRLSEHLGGPSLFMKRDDCTGLATGGNKTRKLEFLMGEALREGADMVVTQGAVQSNHVRQTAAAACRLGMKCHVLLERRVPGRTRAYEETGNVFLDRLFGTTFEFRPDGLDMNAEGQQVADRMRAEGHKTYFIPGGGSNATGAIGYVSCAQEIMEQCLESDLRFDWLVMGTGSSGTQAGLVAGFHILGYDLPVMGISVRQPRDRQIGAVLSTTQKTLARLGGPQLQEDKILVDDGYVGEGYGLPTASTLEAIRLTARQEGILLDPVYSAKGMAGLIGLVRGGFFKPRDKVLFLHTGGSTSLFAYEDQIIGSLD